MGWNPKVRFNVNSWNAQENKKGETNGVKLEQVGVKACWNYFQLSLEMFHSMAKKVELA